MKINEFLSSLRDTASADFFGASAGGDTSNTPPAKLHEMAKSPGKTTFGGEDWFEVVTYLNWHPAKARRVFAELDRLKDEAFYASKAKDGFGRLPGSNGQWIVHPTGCTLGENGKGPRMNWKFERDGIIFGISDKVEAHATRPSGFVRMSGEVLLALGSAESVWSTVLGWLEELGASVEKALVSRVDICLDCPGMSVQPFVDATRDGRLIRRSHNRREFYAEVHGKGRRDTGVTLGKGTLLRVYDKAVECKDLVKRSWMIKKRWGGKDQEQAARAEFQLRREFLTAKKCRVNKGEIQRPAISTVEDYFHHRADLVRYLVRVWIRFCAHGFDAGHTERAKNLPEWTEIIEGFEQWAGEGEPAPFTPLPRHLCQNEALASQARGCLESIAARRGRVIDNDVDFVAFAYEELMSVVNGDTDIAVRIQKRVNSIALVTADPPACNVPF